VKDSAVPRVLHRKSGRNIHASCGRICIIKPFSEL
jgi:hypothetical protein